MVGPRKEWNIEDEGRRPCLSDKYRIHLNTQRTYIVDLVPEGDTSRAPRLVASVNGDAGRILDMCRGQSTVGEILDKLGHEKDSDEAGRIKGFLDSAASEGHITWDSETGFKTDRQLTGSLEKFIPAHISVEITHRCNLKCNYCYHGDLDEKVHIEEELSLEELIRALEEWRALGLLSVELTGGEPTISKDFIPLLKYCLDSFSLIAILTNGTNITEEFLELVGKAKEKVLVGFSLDSPTPELFAEITGTPARLFDNVVEGIRGVVGLGIQTNVAMTVVKENVDYVYEMVGFLQDLGVSGFSPALPAPQGYGYEGRWQWNMYLNQQFYDQITRIRKDYPDYLTNLNVVKEPKTEPDGLPEDSCDIGKRVAIMAPDGLIRPCLMMPEDWSIGSVREKSVNEILLSDSFQKVADIAFPPTATCKECVYEKFCEGCILTPVSIARKEGKLCGWWEESGLSDWLRTSTKAEIMESPESVVKFTEKSLVSQCSHCPKSL